MKKLLPFLVLLMSFAASAETIVINNPGKPTFGTTTSDYFETVHFVDRKCIPLNGTENKGHLVVMTYDVDLYNSANTVPLVGGVFNVAAGAPIGVAGILAGTTEALSGGHQAFRVWGCAKRYRIPATTTKPFSWGYQVGRWTDRLGTPYNGSIIDFTIVPQPLISFYVANGFNFAGDVSINTVNSIMTTNGF